MQIFHTNIEDDTLNNSFFRKVLFTGKYCQLVVMSLKPGEEIGMEVHDNVDQFFRFEKGLGKVIADGVETMVKEDDVVIIEAGTQHNIVNVSEEDDLKIYTIYSPPNHPPQTIHKTLKEAMEAEEEHHKI